MITVQYRNNRIYAVELEFGKKSKVLFLRPSDTNIEAMVAKLIQNQVKQYIRNRKFACNHGYVHNIRERMEAVRRLEYKFADQKTLTNLKKVLASPRTQEDLIKLVPGLTSKYHTAYHKLVCDLIYWSRINQLSNKASL